MPVPKRKTSRARRDNRRAHIHLKTIRPQRCPRCGEPKLPHRVCISCGYYRDREVFALEQAKASRAPKSPKP